MYANYVQTRLPMLMKFVIEVSLPCTTIELRMLMYCLYSLSLNIEVVYFKMVTVYSKLSVLHAKQLVLSNFKPLRREDDEIVDIFYSVSLFSIYNQRLALKLTVDTTHGIRLSGMFTDTLNHPHEICNANTCILTENRLGNYKVPLTSLYI